MTLIDANEQQVENAGVQLATYVAPGDLHTVAGTDDSTRSRSKACAWSTG